MAQNIVNEDYEDHGDDQENRELGYDKEIYNYFSDIFNYADDSPINSEEVYTNDNKSIKQMQNNGLNYGLNYGLDYSLTQLRYDTTSYCNGTSNIRYYNVNNNKSYQNNKKERKRKRTGDKVPKVDNPNFKVCKSKQISGASSFKNQKKKITKLPLQPHLQPHLCSSPLSSTPITYTTSSPVPLPAPPPAPPPAPTTSESAHIPLTDTKSGQYLIRDTNFRNNKYLCTTIDDDNFNVNNYTMSEINGIIHNTTQLSFNYLFQNIENSLIMSKDHLHTILKENMKDALKIISQKKGGKTKRIHEILELRNKTYYIFISQYLELMSTLFYNNINNYIFRMSKMK